MNGRNQYVTTLKQVRVLKIKAAYLAKLLRHKPSPEELSNYILSFEGKELDVSKRIGELNLSHYNLKCEPKMKVRVFPANQENPHALMFIRSISVSTILDSIVGKEKREEYFLTERYSPIVVKTKITSSLDLTRTFYHYSLILSPFFLGGDRMPYGSR